MELYFDLNHRAVLYVFVNKMMIVYDIWQKKRAKKKKKKKIKPQPNKTKINTDKIKYCSSILLWNIGDLV